MNVFSLYFLAFLCVLVLLFHGSRSAAWRRGVLSVANAVFLAPFVTVGWNLAALALLLAASYGSLRVIQLWPRRSTLVASVTAAAAALLLVKRYAILGPVVPDDLLRHSLELVGISYMTFKYIHVAVDLRQGQLERLDLLTYLNYQLGFFSLVAGPIQRYNDFAAFWRNVDTGPADGVLAMRHWRRMLVGLLKMGVVGSLAWFLDDLGMTRLGQPGDRWAALGSLMLAFYAFPAYVYFNFSGYCDAVIGAAGVLGMKQQENFHRPFLARNLIDFWNRWHISLTLWIRDYIFTPLYKTAAANWRGLATPLGYGALFLALFIAGVWHGATWNFVAFGLVHGVGVAAVQLYGDLLRRRIGRQGIRHYLSSPLVRAAAVFITIHYVCLSFFFFRPGLRRTLLLLSEAGSAILTGDPS